jgi:hypothetical protein
MMDEKALAAFLAETCPECGTPGPQRHLAVVGGCGTCTQNDPRPVIMLPRDLQTPPAGKCYRTAGGSMVHVKPECRCRR